MNWIGYLLSWTITLLFGWVWFWRGRVRGSTARGWDMRLLGVVVRDGQVGLSRSDFVAEFVPASKGAAPNVVMPDGFLDWLGAADTAKELVELARKDNVGILVVGVPEDRRIEGPRKRMILDLIEALKDEMSAEMTLRFWGEDLSGFTGLDGRPLGPKHTPDAAPDATEMLWSFVEHWRGSLGQGR